MKNYIKRIDVIDLRFPTSDSLHGSDPFHTKPNYSAVITTIRCSTGESGLSIVFTVGAGNDWIAYGIKQLIPLVINLHSYAVKSTFHSLMINWNFF